MGEGTSKTTQTIDLSLNHPKFGNVKIVGDHKERFMQIMMCIGKKDYDKWKNQLEKQKPKNEFMFIPVKEEFSSIGLCGGSGTLVLDFEDFPYLLTEEMVDRKGKKKLFEQQELWYLLFALISVKKDMIPPFSKIGDIRPHNIFINDQSEVKIVTMLSWPHEETNFTKTIESEVTYLSPQEMNQLDKGVPESARNYESELFSIGLTLLSAIAKEDFLHAYDLNKLILNTNIINEKLNQFKISRAYSDIFKGVVCNICEFEQQKRITTKELWNWISPHQEKIRKRQNFYISSAPDKIRQQVNEVRKETRKSGSSEQKANSLSSNPPQTYHPGVYTFTGITNIPNFSPAQSIYVSPNHLKQPGDVNSQTTTTPSTQQPYGVVPIHKNNTSNFQKPPYENVTNQNTNSINKTKLTNINQEGQLSQKQNNKVGQSFSVNQYNSLPISSE